MSSWHQILTERIRDDYVLREGQSCLYRYILGQVKNHPRVRLKQAWLREIADDAHRQTIALLLADIALQMPQPADIASLRTLCPHAFADGESASKRKVNSALRKDLSLMCETEKAPVLSTGQLTQIAQELCLASGKVGKNTSVQALSAYIDYKAGDHALLVGDEKGELPADEACARKKVHERIHYEARQMLLNMGVPKTGKSPLGAPRVSDIPVKLVESALKDIEGLARDLGMSGASTDEVTAEEIRAVMRAISHRFCVVLPTVSDPLTGMTLCILSAEFAPREHGRQVKGPFFAVIPQRTLNEAIGEEKKRKCEHSPSNDMIKFLKKSMYLPWAPDASAERFDPIERFGQICGPLRKNVLELYQKFNSDAPSSCPDALKQYFAR